MGVIEFLGQNDKTVAYALLVGLLGLATHLIVITRRVSGDRQVARINSDEALKRHNHEISLKLLDQLRTELDRAMVENNRIAPYMERARLLARHLDNILEAHDDAGRAMAEQAARAYLEQIRYEVL